MDDYDNRIKSALSANDETFLRDLEDGRGIFRQMGALFRGPMASMTIIVMIFIIIFMVLLVFCGWKALTTQDVRMTVLWCAGGLASLIPHGLLRIWILSRVNHLAVLRELKKLELKITRLEEGGRP